MDGIENTNLYLTAAQFNQLDGTGTITGGATVYITQLLNNTDVDGVVPLEPDTAVIDTSLVSAPKGTVSLGEPTVTLDAVSSLAGFEIVLANGQMIQFSTAVQANGAEVTELTGTPAFLTVTAIAWLFDDLGALSVVDTSGYDADINTLYINEDLVDGKNEEDLWTTLAESIVVEKTNVADIPDVLIAVDRVNTFEALTAIAGVTYDDQDEFESIQTLRINLEGNTNIGNVVIADTVGQVAFTALTVNSYEDRSTLTGDNGFTFQPNIVGNITINNTADANTTVTLNTFTSVNNVLSPGDIAGALADPTFTTTSDGGFYDRATWICPGSAWASGTRRSGTADGHHQVRGNGGQDDHAGPERHQQDHHRWPGHHRSDISLLNVDAVGFTGVNADLVIGGIVPTGGSAANNALGSFDHIYVVDGYTAPAAPFGAAGNNLLVVAGGNNDFTAGHELRRRQGSLHRQLDADA